jgi:hypothetical protein
MPLHHLLRPGVDCAPDEFDSYRAIGHAQPPQRLEPMVRVPWTGVERRRHLLNESVNHTPPFQEVLAERDAAMEAGSLTLSAVTPAVDAGPHRSSSQRDLGSAGACSGFHIRVSAHGAQCPDAALTPSPLDVGTAPLNEGVA